MPYIGRTVASSLVIFVNLAAVGLAQDAGLPATSDPTAFVDARQAQMSAMQTLGAHIDLGALEADEETFERLEEEAEALAWMLRVVPLLFPEGTSPADLPGVMTHASPAIWEQRERFDALAADALAAAEATTLAADGAMLFERFERLEAVCTACHAEFLAYDPFAVLQGTPPPDEALFEFGEGAVEDAVAGD